MVTVTVYSMIFIFILGFESFWVMIFLYFIYHRIKGDRGIYMDNHHIGGYK
jgi:hypothetical protein